MGRNYPNSKSTKEPKCSSLPTRLEGFNRNTLNGMSKSTEEVPLKKNLPRAGLSKPIVLKINLDRSVRNYRMWFSRWA